MTINEAVRIRVQWKGQTAVETCRHFTLELEFDAQGETTGNHVCILCGEPMTQRSLAA